MSIFRQGCLLAISLLFVATGCDSSKDSPAANQIGLKSTSSDGPLQSDSTLTPAAAAMQAANDAKAASPTGTNADSDDMAVSALDALTQRTVKVLVPTKTFAEDPETGTLKLTFDDLNLLKVLNMDPVTEDAVSWMPEWMKSLDGKNVRIRGYMYPTFDSENIESFVLMWDPQIMNYGPAMQVYNLIEINLKPGTTTKYVPLQNSLEVVGRFKIDLQSDKGQVYQLFAIEDASVIVPR